MTSCSSASPSVEGAGGLGGVFVNQGKALNANAGEFVPGLPWHAVSSCLSLEPEVFPGVGVFAAPHLEVAGAGA